MENPIKMDDLGGKPTIFGNTHILPFKYYFMLLNTESMGFFKSPSSPPPPALWLRRKRSDLAVWRIDRTNEPTNQRTKQTKIANLKIPWKLEDEFNLIHSPRNLACGTQSHEGLEDLFFLSKWRNFRFHVSFPVFFLGGGPLLTAFQGVPHLAADFARLGERLKSPQWAKTSHDFYGLMEEIRRSPVDVVPPY